MKSVGRRTGRAELDEHAEGIHVSEIEVDLKPSQRPKTEIVADIRARLAVLPLSVNVGQPISHRLDHMLSGIRSEIALKIFGDDLDAMRAKAEELRARLAAIPGLTDLQVEKQVRIPQLEIRVDYGRAALYGVQPAAVVDQLSRLSNGRVVSRVIDGYRRFDVVMRLPDSAAHHAGARRSPDRDAVRLDSGAADRRDQGDRRAEPDPARERAAASRRARQQRRPRRHGAASSSESARVLRRHEDAGRHFVSLEGTFQAQEQAARTIGLLSLVSLLLIFAILYSRYRSAVLVADHHRQRAARADRLGRGACGSPASRCRSPA